MPYIEGKSVFQHMHEIIPGGGVKPVPRVFKKGKMGKRAFFLLFFLRGKAARFGLDLMGWHRWHALPPPGLVTVIVSATGGVRKFLGVSLL
jgi:hypothetical protein